LTGTTIPWYS